MNEIYGKIEAKGLNPYFGFMHSYRDGHPALCSDLIEEWRAVIVDSTVLSLVQGNEIDLDAFYKNEETGGVYLNKDCMKIFIKKLEHKINSENKYLEYIDYPVPFRRAIELQINSFSKVLDKMDFEEYQPLIIR